MSDIWYTSDLHFFHEKVAQIRGFKSSLDHDKTITANWRANVKDGDLVYVLGDIASDERYTFQALNLIDGLPGEKILIAGNHDPFHPRHRKFAEWARTTTDRHASILATAPFARRKLLGQDVWLSHFPYVRDRGVSRNMQDRLRNEGNWLLHGHTHGTERVTIQYGLYESQLFTLPVHSKPESLDEIRAVDPTRVYREIHVGLDAWNLAPVSQSTIIDLINQNT